MEKDLPSLSSLPSLAHCSGGWASDVGVACPSVMGTHQNSSLASSIYSQEQCWAAWYGLEVQESTFPLYHFVRNILMYPRARAVHLSVFFMLSLKAWSLSQWLQKASQLRWFRLWGKPAFSADSTNILQGFYWPIKEASRPELSKIGHQQTYFTLFLIHSNTIGWKVHLVLKCL